MKLCADCAIFRRHRRRLMSVAVVVRFEVVDVDQQDGNCALVLGACCQSLSRYSSKTRRLRVPSRVALARSAISLPSMRMCATSGRCSARPTFGDQVQEHECMRAAAVASGRWKYTARPRTPRLSNAHSTARVSESSRNIGPSSRTGRSISISSCLRCVCAT